MVQFMCLKLCDSHLILPISDLADSHVLIKSISYLSFWPKNFSGILELNRMLKEIYYHSSYMVFIL